MPQTEAPGSGHRQIPLPICSCPRLQSASIAVQERQPFATNTAFSPEAKQGDGTDLLDQGPCPTERGCCCFKCGSCCMNAVAQQQADPGTRVCAKPRQEGSQQPNTDMEPNVTWHLKAIQGLGDVTPSQTANSGPLQSTGFVTRMHWTLHK